MGPGYEPAPGIRRVISGTPPVLGMLAMEDTLDLIGEVGIDAVRAKSLQLTAFAERLSDEWLEPLGVRVVIAAATSPGVRMTATPSC